LFDSFYYNQILLSKLKTHAKNISKKIAQICIWLLVREEDTGFLLIKPSMLFPSHTKKVPPVKQG
jgi:hypothetical protein